jgi:hypothetical protein
VIKEPVFDMDIDRIGREWKSEMDLSSPTIAIKVERFVVNLKNENIFRRG